VLSALKAARRDIARELAAVDPDRVTAAQATDLMTVFAEIERLGSAGKVLCSNRASQGMTWRDEGHRSAASWMAEATGTAVGDAISAIETSVALESPSSPVGLARVCGWHHNLITYEGWELTDRTGSWEWREPPGGSSRSSSISATGSPT
jgi:hypothetical protein